MVASTSNRGNFPKIPSINKALKKKKCTEFWFHFQTTGSVWEAMRLNTAILERTKSPQILDNYTTPHIPFTHSNNLQDLKLKDKLLKPHCSILTPPKPEGLWFKSGSYRRLCPVTALAAWYKHGRVWRLKFFSGQEQDEKRAERNSFQVITLVLVLIIY